MILFSCNTVGTEFELGFPTQRYSAITEVPSLSYQGKGTMGQAQNLARGQDGPGQSVKIWDGTKDGTITICLSKSGTRQVQDRTIAIFFL